MSLESQDAPPAATSEVRPKPKGQWIERTVLVLVAIFALGLMMAWFAFLGWALYWLLSGLL